MSTVIYKQEVTPRFSKVSLE